MTRLVRERCDAFVALPMRGRVGSLNAAASLAAVLYAFVIPSRRTGRDRIGRGAGRSGVDSTLGRRGAVR